MQIIFIREKSSKAVTFKISKKTIWISFLSFVIFLLMFFSFGAWSIFQFIPDFAKLNIITNSAKNSELFKDLGIVKGRVESLEKIIKELEAEKKNINKVSYDANKEMLSGLIGKSFDLQNARTSIDKMMVSLDEIDSKIGLMKISSVDNEINKGFLPQQDPIIGRLTSNFGPRYHPISGRMHTHTGTDFSAQIGSPVKAIADGFIVATYISKFGLGKSIDINHGGKYISRYAHLDGIVVKEGDFIKAGQQIARVGSTGSSTGPHLHLEIEIGGRRVDPQAFLHKFRRNNIEKSSEFAAIR